PLWSPDLKPVIASQEEPGGHPEVGQSFDVVVMKVREEDLRYVFRIEAALIEPLVGASPDIEQQLLAVGFDQCRYPESIGEIFRSGSPQQRDLDRGIGGAGRNESECNQRSNDGRKTAKHWRPSFSRACRRQH